MSSISTKFDMDAHKLSKECESLGSNFCDNLKLDVALELLESLKILTAKLEKSCNTRIIKHNSLRRKVKK